MSLITEMHADGTILRQWENGEQDLFSTEEQDQPPADPAVDVPVDHPILEAKRQLAEAYAQKAEAVLSDPTINSIKEIKDGMIQVFSEVSEGLNP